MHVYSITKIKNKSPDFQFQTPKATIPREKKMCNKGNIALNPRDDLVGSSCLSYLPLIGKQESNSSLSRAGQFLPTHPIVIGCKTLLNEQNIRDLRS